MHIPDGLVTPPVWVTLDVLSAGVVGYGARVVEKRIGERQVPALAVMAAFVFAAQKLNFPVGGGTSGHLLGSALAAILLGPWAAVLVMATVIITQCLLFGDGGLAALGANVFNMGILSPLAGYLVFLVAAALLGKRRKGAAAFAAGWSAVMVAALATSFEVILSGKAAPVIILPAMLGTHALVGIGEGLVTAAALSALATVRPDLLKRET